MKWPVSGHCAKIEPRGKQTVPAPRRTHGGRMDKTIRFKLNGKEVAVETSPERMLLWVLRTDLEHTGTKYGCGEGYCGFCTVLVDGKPERSCQFPLSKVEGKSVLTIEGLVQGRPSPPAPAGLRRSRRPPVRLLHAGHDPRGLRPASPEAEPDRGRDRRRPRRATSAGAARTSASSRPSGRPPRP